MGRRDNADWPLIGRRHPGACGAVLVLFAAIGCNYLAGEGSAAKRARGALTDPGHGLWSEHAPEVFEVAVETSEGRIVIEARRELAPHGCDRFYNLVRTGFFDDSRFFRVRRGVFVQFGIPGDPAVAATWRSEAIPDDPVRRSNLRGTVAYAMTGPDTRTTQLFINLADNAHLDAEGFAPIGVVVEGMVVADRLHADYAEAPGGGMRGGRQGKIFAGGNSYLDRDFPLLDRLIRASLTSR